jgi:hypothetical protein
MISGTGSTMDGESPNRGHLQHQRYPLGLSGRVQQKLFWYILFGREMMSITEPLIVDAALMIVIGQAI